MIRIALMILSLLVAGNCLADGIDTRQEYVLGLAYAYGNAGGDELGREVQGIVWQETKAGKYKLMRNPHADDPDIQNRYFGIGQLKLCAVRDVERFYRIDIEADDERLAERLVEEDALNVFIVALYLRYLNVYFDGDTDRAILAYNIGMGTVKRNGLKRDPNHYLAGVRSHIDMLITAGR